MLSWGRRSIRNEPPAGPEGWRAYGIGDVHGRLDLLDGLLEQIAADHDARGASVRPLLVFLGDLIDRGPHSAKVIERVLSNPLPEFRTVVLAGNHEEVLLRLIDGEPGLLMQWLGFGGAECLRSYGLDPDLVAALPEQEALKRVRRAIPEDHVQFLRELGDTFTFGDYLFVHAGIRPGLKLDDQTAKDLRWIRSPFLEDKRDHGAMIIHGHTISDGIDERRNRIGIDTGAYHFGVLTAVGIEEQQRWFHQQAELSSAHVQGS